MLFYGSFGAPAHGAPALGALAALLGLPARTVVDAFIYMTARDFFSAAVRLNLVGPLQAIALTPFLLACFPTLQCG